MIRHSVPLSEPAEASRRNLYSHTPTVLRRALSTSSIGCEMKGIREKVCGNPKPYRATYHQSEHTLEMSYVLAR